MKKNYVTRKVFGKIMHLRKGSMAQIAVDFGVHAIEIMLACGAIFLLGYIVGWN